MSNPFRHNMNTPVLVWYDRRGKRVSKQFSNLYDARSFYASKYKLGKNPTVKKVTQ